MTQDVLARFDLDHTLLPHATGWPPTRAVAETVPAFDHVKPRP